MLWYHYVLLFLVRYLIVLITNYVDNKNPWIIEGFLTNSYYFLVNSFELSTIIFLLIQTDRRHKTSVRLFIHEIKIYFAHFSYSSLCRHYCYYQKNHMILSIKTHTFFNFLFKYFFFSIIIFFIIYTYTT